MHVTFDIDKVEINWKNAGRFRPTSPGVGWVLENVKDKSRIGGSCDPERKNDGLSGGPTFVQERNKIQEYILVSAGPYKPAWWTDFLLS